MISSEFIPGNLYYVVSVYYFYKSIYTTLDDFERAVYSPCEMPKGSVTMYLKNYIDTSKKNWHQALYKNKIILINPKREMLCENNEW